MTARDGADTCDACLVGEYKAGLGPAACETCPLLSTTAATASTDVTDCLCTGASPPLAYMYSSEHTSLTRVHVRTFAAGHTGQITAPGDECTACPEGTFKGGLGDAECTLCPEAATTEEPASTVITDCLCTGAS